MKVGDYVRTKSGDIGKIIKCPFKSMYLDELWGDIGNYETIITDNVYKSSPNIIDLIKVGDFIGKTIVEEVKEFDDGTRIIVMADGFDEYDENEYFLKAGIVTKEQFESMEYKV